MGLLDKIRNIFWEEVEEENDDEPVKVAKKVEINTKKNDPVKTVNEIKKDIEDNSFKNKNIDIKEKKLTYETQEIPLTRFSKKEIKENDDAKIIDNKEEFIEKPKNKFPLIFEDEDFFDDSEKFVSEEKKENVKKNISGFEKNINNAEKNITTSRRELFPDKREISYVESVNRNNGYRETKTFYERHETKTFKPSPIISPIYGILDKNYTSEEVVTKKETYIYGSKSERSLDSVLNKAYGDRESILNKENKEEEKETVKKENTDKDMVDFNATKPNVKSVTLADAEEYYSDLGLAYNVDYNDTSRDTEVMSRSKKKDTKNLDKENNDNLFDLIDSMYNKED